jgi:hypothetical protein
MISIVLQRGTNAFLSLIVLLLVGCGTPVSTVYFAPFPSPSEKKELVHSDHPVIRDAVGIIDSVLVRNGFQTHPTWGPNGVGGNDAWHNWTTYARKGGGGATVYNMGSKDAATMGGKGPVVIYVNFNPGRKKDLRVDLTLRQIAEELGKKYGEDKISVSDERESFKLN